MPRASITLLSWIAFVSAIVLWIGVGLFAWATVQAKAQYVERAASVEQESVQQATALQLRTLARETHNDQLRLEDLAHKDIVAIVTLIEGVGEDVGVPLEISGALSATGVNPALSAQTLVFTVAAQGTFSEVVQVAALLETLPIPAVVDHVRFERAVSEAGASGASGAWRVILETRFLTTATLSQ